MKLLDHPEEYMSGTRVLFLRSRNKDGLKNHKTMTVISKDENDFQESLMLLTREARDGQRIYASASSRDLQRASRNFKEAILDNDYNLDPTSFYGALFTRWVSALMQVNAQEDKRWIFDCDAVDEASATRAALLLQGVPFYVYQTKNGSHYVTKPFNYSLLPDGVKALRHTNPLMLWGY